MDFDGKLFTASSIKDHQRLWQATNGLYFHTALSQNAANVLADLAVNRLLQQVLQNGGDYADIYYENSLTTQVIAEQGRIERVYGGLDRGLGIRVMAGGQTAYGYTTELDAATLEALAQTVAAAVKGKRFEEDIRLHDVAPSVAFQVAEPPARTEIPAKVDFVKRADRVAWGHDKRVQQVKVVYGDLTKEVQIATSNGEMINDERIYALLYVQVVAASGDKMQTGYHPVGGLAGLELLTENPPEQVAEVAAAQAIQMLQARKAPAGTMPVVISAEAGGTMIHEAVGHGLEADLACERLSVYHDKIGERIGSEVVTVIDDASLPGRRGSFRFDDEGVPAQRSVLVENGVLKSYLLDRRYAMQTGSSSTGNGRRESFRHRPICRMSNIFIAPGREDPAAIIRSVDKGLYVRKMGGGQVNTVNGEFVFEIPESYLIENGQLGEAVRGAVLTGNGPDVLNSIDKVGNDQGWAIGTCGKENQGVPVADAQPTIRIPALTVSGA